MSKIAFLIGFYSLLLFLLGSLNLLTVFPISLATIFFLFSLFLVFKNFSLKRASLWLRSLKKLEIVILVILILLAFVNLIGALGPETSFDALWYHLTIPKLYIQNQSIFYIPGNLLYYSAMPKLADLLYIPALMFGNEIWAKFIQYIFGIMCLFVIYQFARLFVNKSLCLIAVLIFYSNIVVAWESTIAYVDLIWAFFILISAYELFLYIKKSSLKHFILSAIFLGFGIGVKVISLRDLLVALVVILIVTAAKHVKPLSVFKNLSSYLVIVLLVSLPWFIFSFYYTGNPIYPFFSEIYSLKDPLLFNYKNIINEYIILFTKAPDPISPIYLIFIPIVVVSFRSARPIIKYLTIYSAGLLILWYFTYQKGAEGRYVIPILGILSVLISAVLEKVDKHLRVVLTTAIIVVAIITIGYRGIANSRYLPIIVGSETKDEFLSKNLNFNFGDFYDTDGYLGKKINKSDRALIYGIHNLYYVNFNFVDSSWRTEGDKFNYVLVRGALPGEFINWEKIYENKTTNVKLYQK